jgi:anti-sigma regulatory factor (Ser/Thr protein kinase)
MVRVMAARLGSDDGVGLDRCAAVTIGRMPGQLARARRVVERSLSEWEVSDDDRAALVLVADELVTNAISHGRGSVELYVYASDRVVRLEVSDRGGGQPRMRPVETAGPNPGGLGLRFVDHLVDMWGTAVHQGRTVVWVQRSVRTA